MRRAGRSWRGGGGGGGVSGLAGSIQGEDAGDASRAERAGGVAGVVVLAAGGGAGGGWILRGAGALGRAFWGLRQPGARRDLAALKQALREVLPQRLADYLAEIGGPKGWSNAALEEV
jgi:hypothetical protein